MPTDQQRLYKLLTHPDWSPEDEQWMTAYIRQKDHSDWQDILQQLFREDQEKNIDPVISERIREQILQRIQNHKEPVNVSSTAHRIHFLKTSWFRYAAAVILTLGVGAYLYNAFKKTDLPLANGNKHLQMDIAPGTNKAVLTLADGTKIILDNTANGNVAQQGNTKIIKLDAGQLSYSSLSRGQGGLVVGSVFYNTISTPRGGQYQIMLPDGTKVWLNAASSIKFPAAFTGTERNVNVTGEAYLEVAKNLKQPFSVNVNGAKIEVLGTSFNVNAYSDEDVLKATLISGSVKVMSGTTSKNNGQSNQTSSPLPQSSRQIGASADQQLNAVILQPGQQAILPANTTAVAASADRQPKISVIDNVNLKEVTAWMNGQFVFAGRPIEDVMKDISRWYDVDIVYEGEKPVLNARGTFSKQENINQILNLLALTGMVHFKVDGRQVIVTAGSAD